MILVVINYTNADKAYKEIIKFTKKIFQTKLTLSWEGDYEDDDACNYWKKIVFKFDILRNSGEFSYNAYKVNLIYFKYLIQ